MNGRRVWGVVVLVILIAVPAWTVYRQTREANAIVDIVPNLDEAATSSAIQPSEQWQPRNLSGGATVQRQRIDQAIETASALSVEEAITSLSQYNESYELAVGATSSSSMGSCFMRSMLADRRISKVFEHLLSLPAAEADMIAQQIFDDHFTTFVKAWQSFAKQEDGYPRTGPPHHAASAGLLFCSYFCSTKTLDSKIQQWNDAMRQPEFENIKGVQILSPSRWIDRLFHLNLLVISGERHNGSLSQLKDELESLCRTINDDEDAYPQVTQMKMFKWSAETLDTDFTHITRGIPASNDAVLIELPGFANPNTSFFLQIPGVAEMLLHCVRTWRDW